MSSAAGAFAGEPILEAFIEQSRQLRWSAVPDGTRAMVRRELLDYIGASIAGRAAMGIPPWLQVLIDLGGRPDTRVLGGPRVPAPTAALCNGYYGHVMEFDDTHDEAVLHDIVTPLRHLDGDVLRCTKRPRLPCIDQVELGVVRAPAQPATAFTEIAGPNQNKWPFAMSRAST